MQALGIEIVAQPPEPSPQILVASNPIEVAALIPEREVIIVGQPQRQLTVPSRLGKTAVLLAAALEIPNLAARQTKEAMEDVVGVAAPASTQVVVPPPRAAD